MGAGNSQEFAESLHRFEGSGQGGIAGEIAGFGLSGLQDIGVLPGVQTETDAQKSLDKHNKLIKLMNNPTQGLNSVVGAGGGDVAQVNPVTRASGASTAQSITNTAANARYGPQSDVGSTPRPSQLMSISDGTTKMLMASSRGATKKHLKIAGNVVDSNMYPSVRQGVNMGPSENINSAGGNGIQNSGDQMDNDANKGSSIPV